MYGPLTCWEKELLMTGERGEIDRLKEVIGEGRDDQKNRLRRTEEGMTLAGYYNNQFTMMQQLEICLRLFVAFIIGGMVGLERSKRFKEAGIRTHIIVCFTAALIMVISKYGFADMTYGEGMEFFGSRGADAARVAAQAVSGISFLCAGVIFKDGSNIKGLTTAAGIWFTAGVGLAIGAGMYLIVAFSVVMFFVLQYVLYRVPIGGDAYEGNRLQFVVKVGQNFDKALHEQLEDWEARVTESKITRSSDGTSEYNIVVRRRTEISYAELKDFVTSRDDIISVSSTSVHTHMP